MSKLGTTAAVAGLGYLLFKILLGMALLLYYIVKMAILLPIVLFAFLSGQAEIRASKEDPAKRKPLPPAPAPAPRAVPDLGPATIESTGDWRKDRETLIRLLAEGKIK